MSIYKLACYLDSQAIYGVRRLDTVPLVGTVLNVGILFFKSISYFVSFITKVHLRSDLLNYLDARTVKECIYLLDPIFGRRAVIADRKTDHRFDHAAIENKPGSVGLDIFANIDKPLIPEVDNDKEKVKIEKSASEQDIVIREIAFKEIKPFSFTHKLFSMLENAKGFPISEEKIWQVATFNLFESSYFEESDCMHRLNWKDCEASAFDSFSSELKNGKKVWREDAFNDQQCHVKANQLKDKMLKLSEEKKNNILISITAMNTLEKPNIDKKTTKIYKKIKKISQRLTNKYSKNISFKRDICLYKKSVSDIVFDNLKEVFLVKAARYGSNKQLLKMLYDDDFSNQICNEVIINLLEKAKIKNKTLDFGHGQILQFGKIEGEPKDYNDLKKIALFNVNELTSKNQFEEPLIDDHALFLAENINQLRESNLDIDLSLKFDEFSRWIKKTFYNPFCASFSRQLDVYTPPKVKKKNHATSKTNDTPMISLRDNFKKTAKRIKNDNKGEAKIFMNYLEKKFKIEAKASWSKNGSCFLSCFIPEHKGEDQYKGIREERERISKMLKKSINNYIDFVQVVPGFNQMKKIEKTKLRDSGWAVCDEVICAENASNIEKQLAKEQQDELKRKAILKRCRKLIEIVTYLMPIEFELFAQIQEKAIYVYKRKVDTFLVDEFDEPLPTEIYGAQYDKGSPYFLIDDYDHYKPLSYLK